MPRILTPTAAQAILARETAEVFLVCLTISGPGLDTLRAVNNTQPIVRSMGTYHPYPFEAVLPEDTDSASPQVQLRIDNVDRQVTRALREYAGVPKCTLEVILASDPDTVEVGPFEFSILSADYDAVMISVQLGYEEDFLNQAVPAQTYTPTNSAGMFV
jgi:hypothetical protein